MEHDEKYLAAKRQVARMKEFYLHLTIYALVMTLVFLINWSSGGPWWFIWPLFGWCIGIVAHAIGTFGFGGKLGSEWEQRKIDQIMHRK